MSAALTNPADWYGIRDRLIRDYANFVYAGNVASHIRGVDDEVLKLINNMEPMVDEISRLQIGLKHGRPRPYKEAIERFNEHLQEMEELFLLRVLARR